MDRVLSEQCIAGRRRAARRRRERGRPVREPAGPARLRTVALGVLALALAGGLAVLLPLLDSGALTQELVEPDVTRAVIDPFPSSGAAPGVEFALTEELYYQVREGETLSEIADAFDLPVRVLAEHNSLANPDALRVGQTLLIPPPTL